VNRDTCDKKKYYSPGQGSASNFYWSPDYRNNDQTRSSEKIYHHNTLFSTVNTDFPLIVNYLQVVYKKINTNRYILAIKLHIIST